MQPFICPFFFFFLIFHMNNFEWLDILLWFNFKLRLILLLLAPIEDNQYASIGLQLIDLIWMDYTPICILYSLNRNILDFPKYGFFDVIFVKFSLPCSLYCCLMCILFFSLCILLTRFLTRHVIRASPMLSEIGLLDPILVGPFVPNHF